MQLIDFWKSLLGVWNFERVFSDQFVQIGILRVVKKSHNVYEAQEQGVYKESQQTFFRNYNFCWENNFLHIYGENPKDGYVLLHTLSDDVRIHTHTCKNDRYLFELLQSDSKSWRSSTIITGPSKNLSLITSYKRF